MQKNTHIFLQTLGHKQMGRLVFPYFFCSNITVLFQGWIQVGPEQSFRVMAMLKAQIGLQGQGQGFVDFLKLRISADGKKRQGEGLDATVQEGQVEFRP